MTTTTYHLDPQRLAARLASKLQPEGDCLVFSGTRTDQGYGNLTVGRKTIKAHRIAWELVNGRIPPGLCVCHRCDNPSCCRVEHLFLGTVAENNADRARKGRSKGVFEAGDAHPARARAGERHWSAKLSDADVLTIRRRRSSGETVTSIADAFGVHPATVSRIARLEWRAGASL